MAGNQYLKAIRVHRIKKNGRQKLEKSLVSLSPHAVILQIFGAVLFSVFSVVKGFTEKKKRHLNEKNTLRNDGSNQGCRNLN